MEVAKAICAADVVAGARVAEVVIAGVVVLVNKGNPVVERPKPLCKPAPVDGIVKPALPVVAVGCTKENPAV